MRSEGLRLDQNKRRQLARGRMKRRLASGGGASDAGWAAYATSRVGADDVRTETMIVKILKSVPAEALHRSSRASAKVDVYRSQAFSASGLLLGAGPAAWPPPMRGPNDASLRATAILDPGGASFRLVTAEI